jgi:NodT family efflux transporter outer membrane factor (OMF) lipoprotein
MNKFRFPLIALLLTTTGCSLAPIYKTPETPVPANYKETGNWVASNGDKTVAVTNWWEIFGDTDLNALETRVTGANQNLKAAVARYDQARNIAKASRAAFFPSLTANAGATTNRVSRDIARSAPPHSYGDIAAELDVSYEVDLWGRVRNAVNANEALAQASAADLAAMDLGLHSELAVDYFTLRGYDAQQDILAQAVTVYQKTFDLIKHREKGGIAIPADVDQAQAQLEDAKTQQQDALLKRQQLEHAIAVLVGEMPEGFNIKVAKFDFKPAPVETGAPSVLLQRRPDIASAERQVAAANDEIGVARAAYFPSLNLTGGGGVESSALGTLFNAPSLFWSIGPQAAFNVFDGGRISALTDQARGVYNEAVADYRQTVLTAFQDVEDNLAATRQLQLELQSQQNATAALERSLKQAETRYTGGVYTYLDVSIEQTKTLDAELALIDLKIRQAAANIHLIVALGGSLHE